MALSRLWVAGCLVHTATQSRAVQAEMTRRTAVFTERSNPARKTSAGSRHKVAVHGILALASVLAVGAKQTFATLYIDTRQQQ